MLDMLHLPESQLADVQIFNATAVNPGVGWATWNKRRGTSMTAIYAWGAGGNGGNGVVGANSTAAGGGGGGSGGQSVLVIPNFLLPDALFVSVGYPGAACRVAVAPDVVVNNQLIFANPGGNGGNAAGATAGAAGTGAPAASIGSMPLAGLGQIQLLAGQAGIIGGVAVAGAALTLPVTGLLVTGGTGGGGLPAAAAVGTNGGAFTVAGIFPPNPGGIGAAVATTPGGNGSNGITGIRNLAYDYGGTGGGSSHGTATTTGLFGGVGGRGGIGCGGGGGGGALTGSVQGIGGLGGPGQVIIISW